MKSLFPSIVFILLGSLLFINSTRMDQPNGYVIGDTADDFALRNYDGRTVSMSDYKNARGYILVFTSNHCPYAEAYEDRLISLHKKYADKGYPLIAINPNAPQINKDDNMDSIRKKAITKKFPFPYLSDSLQTVFPKFGADRTPHVFVLDSLRRVKYMGTVDDNAEASFKVKKRYVEDAIQALMRGEEPFPASTKTVGCKIRLMPRDSN
jgi:peroxiredoxin